MGDLDPLQQIIDDSLGHPIPSPQPKRHLDSNGFAVFAQFTTECPYIPTLQWAAPALKIVYFDAGSRPLSNTYGSLGPFLGPTL